MNNIINIFKMLGEGTEPGNRVIKFMASIAVGCLALLLMITFCR